MRTILVDDEPANTLVLKQMLQDYCPDVEIVGEAENSKKGIDVINREKPDLVFLDIEMPFGNAFDMLDKLSPVNFDVIFVTAFDNYTLKAFKYSALDYLLKPVNIDELVAAVGRVAQRQKAAGNIFPEQVENLLRTLKRNDQPLLKIAVPSQEGVIFVSIADIVRCEASARYTYIYLRNGQKLISTINIKEYEELLPDNIFSVVHHTHLINLNFVKKYHRGRGGYLEMEDGTIVEVATRRKVELLLRFGIRS